MSMLSSLPRERTRARAQISRSQLPRLFEQSGLVLYRRVGDDWCAAFRSIGSLLGHHCLFLLVAPTIQFTHRMLILISF